MMKKTSLLVSAFSLCLGAAQAEELKPSGWVILPAIGSSPETGFQYGVYAMHQFAQTAVGEPQDRLSFLLQGTTKGQYQANIQPDIFIAGGDWNLTGGLSGVYWPTPYYGQSNEVDLDADEESYKLTAFTAEAGAAYAVTPNLRLGGLAFVESEDIEDDAGNTLLSEADLGFDGGLYVGLGLTASWDTTDDRDWPTRGTLAQAELRQYNVSLGSDYDYVLLQTAASQYFPIGSDVLALGVNYAYGNDETPFSRLPRPSGESSLRGADGNLWIGHQLFGLQTEYRMTLTERWATTAFIDAAQVADDADELAWDRFHTALGGGIRYATLAGSRFNVRADIALIDVESIGFTISVGEAF
ncbi:BamA/TamA family outer membrane protein [Saccharospirillum mangrovi]|uniref:BamA/TamA family outer membrane protein n=1 Tax=Saccharospirillum mangrovi TaxID=2161747 RepID=UPI000D389D40|nr:BamA/TamA family outer membrane protein [Saccharospirillum mangrovi]